MNRKLVKEIFGILESTRNINSIIKKLGGEILDWGQYRTVYTLKQNPNFVVKIERDLATGIFANVQEYRNYADHQYWNLVSGMLAPCYMISSNGQILFQQRVYWDNKVKKDYPKQLPVVFTDIKRSNFGWSKKGEFMCCDYSCFVIPQNLSAKKYKNVKWRGEIPKTLTEHERKSLIHKPKQL